MTIKRIAAIALCSMALGTMTCYAKKAKEPAVLLTKVDSINYFIGTKFAQDLKQMEWDESDLRKDVFIKGFSDALNGKMALNEDTMVKVTIEYFQAKQAERQKAATEAYNQIAKKYEAMGFKDLGKPNEPRLNEPRLSDYDGPTVRMKSIYEGTGDSIKQTDVIYMDYEGKLAANDSVFDSTADKDPALFPLNQLIPGFAQALCQMKKGAKAIFLIPSELAYSERVKSPFPANSALVFTIEVKEVFKNEEEAQAYKEKQNK